MKVLKVAVVEIWKQPVEIEVIQPLNVVIPTIGVETIIALNTNFLKSGILTGTTMNLGCGLEGFLMERNLNKSSKLLETTIGIVGTP